MPKFRHREKLNSVHEDAILQAAEQLFRERGYRQTSIRDLSDASGYSRRAIYNHFIDKEDILYKTIIRGLRNLNSEIERDLAIPVGFLQIYDEVCIDIRDYQKDYPFTSDLLRNLTTDHYETFETSELKIEIYRLGARFHDLLAQMLLQGQQEGSVRQDIDIVPSVYVLTSSLASFFSVMDSRGKYLSRSFNMSREAWFTYATRQIIQSLLTEPIPFLA